MVVAADAEKDLVDASQKERTSSILGFLISLDSSKPGTVVLALCLSLSASPAFRKSKNLLD